MSNFSFFHIDFKSCQLHMRGNVSACGVGLKLYKMYRLNCIYFVNVEHNPSDENGIHTGNTFVSKFSMYIIYAC